MTANEEEESAIQGHDDERPPKSFRTLGALSEDVENDGLSDSLERENEKPREQYGTPIRNSERETVDSAPAEPLGVSDELEALIDGAEIDDSSDLPVLSHRQFLFDFLEEHYGYVEQEPGRSEDFLRCWYERQSLEKISPGDRFFYAFTGKAYLVIEVPCAHTSELTAEELFEVKDLWGRGRRGSAHTFHNVVSTVLVEDHPEHALVMIDQLVTEARAFEAKVMGIEAPTNLFGRRQDSG